MTPGPTIIKKCSACSKPIEQHTIASGNTFGATFWTDGKRDAPMLPDQPWLVICPHCHSLLWIDELDTLGEVEPWGEGNSNFANARAYRIPSSDDYFALLENGVPDPEKERYIRLRAWWAGNDKRRTSAGEIPMSIRETQNLAAIAQKLSESEDNDRVMKAEVMRELGQFDNALSLLARPVDKDIAQAAATIRRLSEKRDPCVREMRFR